jgi:hypothetical protein
MACLSLDGGFGMFASTYPDVTPTEDLHVLAEDDLDIIAEKRQEHNTSLVILSDHTEICPLLRIVLSVSTSAGQRHKKSLVDCAATLDFVSEDFATRMGLHARKPTTKTPIRC